MRIRSIPCPVATAVSSRHVIHILESVTVGGAGIAVKGTKPRSFFTRSETPAGADSGPAHRRRARGGWDHLSLSFSFLSSLSFLSLSFSSFFSFLTVHR